MTTLTASETMPQSAPPVGRRLIDVVRLNLANPWNPIVWPWIILGVIFIGNYTVWLLIFSATPASAHAEITEGMGYSGASSFFFVYMLIVAVQTMNSTFPFALGYGVTRRDFFIGSALTFTMLSAAYAIALAVLAEIEIVSNGWGLGGRMFTPVYFGDGSFVERVWVFFCAFMFFFFIGAALASVYVRWKATGMTIFFIVFGFLLLGAGALIVLTDAWASIGSFFAAAGFVGGWSATLVVAAVAGIAGYVILQRATPRNS